MATIYSVRAPEHNEEFVTTKVEAVKRAQALADEIERDVDVVMIEIQRKHSRELAVALLTKTDWILKEEVEYTATPRRKRDESDCPLQMSDAVSA